MVHKALPHQSHHNQLLRSPLTTVTIQMLAITHLLHISRMCRRIISPHSIATCRRINLKSVIRAIGTALYLCLRADFFPVAMSTTWSNPYSLFIRSAFVHYAYDLLAVA